MDTTVTSSPLNVTVLPTDLAEATGNSVDTGKSCSSMTFKIVRPTHASGSDNGNVKRGWILGHEIGV